MTNLNLKNPTKELIEQYLQEKGFETKDDSGQIRTNKCPFCHDSKIDWTHFYISHSGLYFCHKCGSQGNLTALVKHFGDFEMTPQKGKNLNEPIKSPQIIMPQKKKELTDPNTEELKKYSESAEEYHKNLFDKKNKTAEKILEYLNTDRGLEKYTLEFFKIGWTGSSISIPIVEEGKVVNIRFRKSPFDTNDKIPKMLNSKGGKMTLFNADILKTANKVVVTEGEIDAMTLWQRGWAEVVSITCGANTFKEEWVELFKTQKSIYLCYDNDEVGKKGIEVAVEKLGAGKCYQVLLPKQLQETKKDLNEFFVKDKKSIDDFYNLYNSAKKINIDYEHIKHIKDLTVETKNLLLGSDTLRGLSTGYPSVDKLWAGMRKGDLIILSGDTNVGKCHAKGTKILMQKGNLKKVEDLTTKDYVMGVDSKPRKVLKLARGKEQMYEIIPYNGAEPFTVNKNHILSLKKTATQYPYYKDYLNITVKDYLKVANVQKHIYKLWHPKIIVFKDNPQILSPYFLGLWLGDGTSIYPCITTADKEIKDWLKKYAKKLNLQLTEKVQKDNKSNYYCLTREKKYKSFNKTHKNKYIYEVKGIKGYGNVKSMKEHLKNLNLLGNKHIPSNYKINSEKNRLALLAGLIDSDGNKELAGYSFCNTNKQLCNDVIFLARSLGFFASTLHERYTTCNGKKFKSYRVYISGDIERIPIKLKRKQPQKRKGCQNWLTTGFKIKKLNVQDYYGFTLDGDQLYMLENFIVNHNTFFAQNIILNLARSGVNSMLFSLEQPVEEIVERFMLLDSELNFQQDKEKDEKTAIKNLDLACSKLASVPIYLYSGYDRIEPKLLGEISSKAVKDFGCEIVFIDHLHYFATGDRRQRTVEIGDMVRYVKLLARKLQIPIVLIAHIKYLEHGGKVPTMDDLKDSSAIKQDADIVALLYRERDKNTRELESSSILNTDKNRHGKMGQRHFTFGDGKEYKDAQGKEIAPIPIGQFQEWGDVDLKNNPNSPKAQFDQADQTVTQQYTNLQDKSLQNVPPVTKTNISSVQKHPDEIAEEKDLKASREESKDIKIDEIEKEPF